MGSYRVGVSGICRGLQLTQNPHKPKPPNPETPGLGFEGEGTVCRAWGLRVFQCRGASVPISR